MGVGWMSHSRPPTQRPKPTHRTHFTSRTLSLRFCPPAFWLHFKCHLLFVFNSFGFVSSYAKQLFEQSVRYNWYKKNNGTLWKTNLECPCIVAIQATGCRACLDIIDINNSTNIEYWASSTSFSRMFVWRLFDGREDQAWVATKARVATIWVAT